MKEDAGAGAPKEYVYILSNPAMPGLVKVGKTTNDAGARAIELFTTGVPERFVVEFCAAVANCAESEGAAHRAMKAFRWADNREFFRIDVETAIAMVCVAIERYSVVVDRPRVVAAGRAREAKEKDAARRTRIAELQASIGEIEKAIRQWDVTLHSDADGLRQASTHLESLHREYKTLGLKPVKQKPGLRERLRGRSVEYDEAFSQLVRPWEELERRIDEANEKIRRLTADGDARMREAAIDRVALKNRQQALRADLQRLLDHDKVLGEIAQPRWGS